MGAGSPEVLWGGGRGSFVGGTSGERFFDSWGSQKMAQDRGKSSQGMGLVTPAGPWAINFQEKMLKCDWDSQNYILGMVSKALLLLPFCKIRLVGSGQGR